VKEVGSHPWVIRATNPATGPQRLGKLSPEIWTQKNQIEIYLCGKIRGESANNFLSQKIEKISGEMIL